MDHLSTSECEVCKRKTKYSCVSCCKVICTVCSEEVEIDVEGYSEENYCVSKCRGDTCCRKRKLGVDKDADKDVVIEVQSVRSKVGKEERIKKQTSIAGFFGGKIKEKKIRSCPTKAVRTVSVATLKNVRCDNSYVRHVFLQNGHYVRPKKKIISRPVATYTVSVHPMYIW